jgi:hypothetical protein
MAAFPKNRLNARRTFASNDKAKRSKDISKSLLEMFEKKSTGIKNPAANWVRVTRDSKRKEVCNEC